jgi:hypothetical protein
VFYIFLSAVYRAVSVNGCWGVCVLVQDMLLLQPEEGGTVPVTAQQPVSVNPHGVLRKRARSVMLRGEGLRRTRRNALIQRTILPAVALPALSEPPASRLRCPHDHDLAGLAHFCTAQRSSHVEGCVSHSSAPVPAHPDARCGAGRDSRGVHCGRREWARDVAVPPCRGHRLPVWSWLATLCPWCLREE